MITYDDKELFVLYHTEQDKYLWWGIWEDDIVMESPMEEHDLESSFIIACHQETITERDRGLIHIVPIDSHMVSDDKGRLRFAFEPKFNESVEYWIEVDE